MSVTARIKFVQGVSTPPAGEALIGVAGTLVTASSDANQNVDSWQWEWIDVPPGSGLVVGIASSGQVPTFSFTPPLNVPGGYHLHLTVRDSAGNAAEDFRVFQVPEYDGRIIVPFAALAPALNFGGQLRGWAKYEEERERYDRGQLLLVSTSPTNLTSSLNYILSVATGSVTHTINLPASPSLGQCVTVKDAGNNAAVRNITVSGNGKNIDGSATNVINANRGYLSIVYNGTEWMVVT